jgi:hypothetical protein
LRAPALVAILNVQVISSRSELNANRLWQYFVNYNFGNGWALSAAPSIDADGSQRWTVPVGGGITRTIMFSRQPMTLDFQYYYNPIRPDNASSSTVRFNIASTRRNQGENSRPQFHPNRPPDDGRR